MEQIYSPAWLTLSRHIGESLISPEQDMQLNFGSLSGDLLCWKDAQTGSEILTCHDEWLRWVSRQVPAQSCQDYASSLLNMLSEWAFAPLGTLLGVYDFSPQRQPECPPDNPSGLILTLQNEEHRLRILLQCAHWEKLTEATAQWLAQPQIAVSGLPVPLCVGRTSLLSGDCNKIVDGTGVALCRTPDLVACEVWLMLGDCIARAHLMTDGRVKIVSTFETHELPTEHNNRDSKMEKIPVTLTAEIGQVILTLGELQQLKPGDILQHVAQLDECVRLKVGGYTVAKGLLVKTGNGWLVRISGNSDSGEDPIWTP